MIHNPENVESPGPGYRFLTVEEVEKRRSRKRVASSPNIEGWYGGMWLGGYKGYARIITYRTKLTPEELEAEG